MILNDKLKSMCEQVVLACFKVLFQNLPGEPEKNHESQ